MHVKKKINKKKTDSRLRDITDQIRLSKKKKADPIQ